VTQEAEPGNEPPSAHPPVRLSAAVPSARFRASGAFSALRHRNFRFFFYGQLVSLAGTWMQQVALSWLVLTVTDSAFYVGLVNALDALPVLLLALYAGVVVDRVSRHKLIITTQVTAMVLALILASLVLTGGVKVGHIMVIAGCFGIVNAFDIPGRHTFYTDLVGKDDLISAVALNSVSFNATRIVGPAIAGMVLGIAGAGVCFLVNGISYLAVLWGLFRMDLPPVRRTPASRSAVRNIMEGLSYIGRDRRMRALVTVSALITIFGAPFLVLLPVIAKHELGRGASAYGWMMAAVGLGALLGALWIAGPARRMSRGRIILYSASLFSILVVALSVTRNMALILVLLALTGFCMVVSGAISNTLMQTLAPDELRGRVVSVYTLAAVGLAPVGAVAAGAVSEKFGAPVALALGGVICLIGSLTVVLRTPELRDTR
jgi:MFS family permease